jgi:hypothetical protein
MKLGFMWANKQKIYTVWLLKMGKISHHKLKDKQLNIFYVSAYEWKKN